MDFPILSVTIFIPLIAGLIILLFGRNKPGLIRPLALVASTLVLLFTVILWASYSIKDAGYQFTEYLPWLPELGIAYHLGVDGIGIAMLLNYMGKKEYLPFFFIGYFLVVYLNLNLMAIAIFGAFIALFYYYQATKEKKVANG